MTPKTLKPGTYRLTQDFLSPTPDQRFRNDWRRKPTIEAGTIFHVRDTLMGSDCLEAFTGPFSCNVVTNGIKSQWRTLFDYLEPVPETPSGYLKREYSVASALRALDALYQEGKFTLDDITRVLQAKPKE